MFPICIMICFKFAFGSLYDMENNIEPVKAVYVNTDELDLKEILVEAINDFGLAEVASEIRMMDVIEAIENRDANFFDNYEIDESTTTNYFKAHPDIAENIANIDLKEYLSSHGIDNLGDIAYGIIFRMALDASGTEDADNQCFDLIEVSTIEEAEALLDSGERHAVFIYENGKVRTELSSDYSQTDLIVIQTFLKTFDSAYTMMSESFIDENGDFILFTDMADETKWQDASYIESLREQFGEGENGFSTRVYVKAKESVFEEEPNPYNWYYYSTFVMGIMFQILTGIGIVADTQADLSKRALRVGLSSTSKGKIYAAIFASRMTIIFICEAVQLLIMRYVFEIPIGNRIPQLVLFVVVASIFATSLGEVLGLFLKGEISKRENLANAMLMISVFLSGEMMASLPGMFEANCPIINRINPATILNFAFYKLVFYEQLDGFYINVLVIAVAAAIFIVISIMKIRRQRYASL